MGCAQPAKAGFSPLDEELGLLPGQVTPILYENLVRLGAWMPFREATEMLKVFTGAEVSEFAVRQNSLAAGEAYVSEQSQEVDRLEKETPVAPEGANKALLSADGAYVPLVHGEWAEVKTVVIGEVSEKVWDAKTKGWVVHSQNHTYFSRLAEAGNFDRLALVETQRRGLENAGKVGAVQDGAVWLQGFTDYHRPDALRILDFAHATEYISKIGQATFGANSAEQVAWLEKQLHQLKHTGPDQLLVELNRLVKAHPEAQALKLPEALAYLEKRRAQMQYHLFVEQGFPIGSGAVESANKVVVEARLKGAGMHWARPHVDPMLALRNLVCNRRWEEDWPRIESRLRSQTRKKRLQRRLQRTIASCPPLLSQPVISIPVPLPISSPSPVAPSPVAPSTSTPTAHRRPAPNHPWRRSPVGRARFSPPPGKL
jgi:hypothetical protein